MFAPGILGILREFGAESSKTTATFLLSIYILGFAFGPLFVAPMSETYGRSLLYNISNVFFAVFSICTALSNSIGMMMAFRFLMGVAGSVPITIGSGSIADIMPVEMRGRAMAAWALGPLLGPAIGPVAGGYLIRASSWRWVYWLIAMLTGVIAVFTFFTLQESYAPVILERKAAKLRKETGNQALRGQFTDTSISAASRLKLAIIRPVKLLFLAPIITSMASYVAITCKCAPVRPLFLACRAGLTRRQQMASSISSSLLSALCSRRTTASARARVALSTSLPPSAWHWALAFSAPCRTRWSERT